MIRALLLLAAVGGAYWYLQPRNSGVYRGYYWASIWERSPDGLSEGWWYTVKEPVDGEWVEITRDFGGPNKASARSAAHRQIDRFAFEDGPGEAKSAPERIAEIIP